MFGLLVLFQSCNFMSQFSSSSWPKRSNARWCYIFGMMQQIAASICAVYECGFCGRLCIFLVDKHFVLLCLFCHCNIILLWNCLCFSIPSSVYHSHNAAGRWDTNNWTSLAYTVYWLAKAEVNLHWKVWSILLDITILWKSQKVYSFQNFTLGLGENMVLNYWTIF